MPSKRGRPESLGNGDVTQRLQRERWRAQQRASRARRARALADDQPLQHRRVGALSYAEQVIDFTRTTMEEESAEPTPLQLGLRLQGLRIAQDPGNATLEHDTRDVEEAEGPHRIRTQRQTTTVDSVRTIAPPSRGIRNVPRSTAPTSPSPGVSNVQSHQRTTQQATPRQAEGFFRRFATPIPSGASSSRSQHGGDSSGRTVRRSDPPNRGHGESESPDPRPTRATIDYVTPQPPDWAANPWRGAASEEMGDEEGDHYADHFQADDGVYDDSRVSRRDSASSDDGVHHRNPGRTANIQDQHLLDQPTADSSEGDGSELVDFMSERSIHSSNDDDDDEPTPVQYISNKLYLQLQNIHHGCTLEEHEELRLKHAEDAGDNHHGLTDVFNDPEFPSVIESDGMLTPERLAEQRLPTADIWRTMFCGIPREGLDRRPANVCLHKEETTQVRPEISYDIDSFLGFPTSLEFARKGLCYQPSPLMRQNISTDVHVETTVYYATNDERRPTGETSRMLRDVPHFHLGRVEGAQDISLFVLFPHAGDGDVGFKCLTDKQLARWTDKVYMPAVQEFNPAHYNQHLPATYRNAVDDSRAHQVEARQVETASYRGRQYITYHIQPNTLGAVWTEVLDRVENDPGLRDFRDPELFFTAKGTKLRYKSNHDRPELLDTMVFFRDQLAEVIDLDFVDTARLFVDIGKEVCANVSLSRTAVQHVGEEPQVYLWRRCCQQKYMDWMYDEKPPKVGGAGQLYFTQNMLRDTGSLTSVSPKRSKHRSGGLLYSQFYNSVKEIYDATKCFPFTNDAMEELTLDPSIRKAARSIVGGNRRSAKVVERGYLASKVRTRNALSDSGRKSYGIREEHRVTWELFNGVMDACREQGSGWHEYMEDCPPYAFAVRTSVYLDFLRRSADKYASGFEVVRAMSMTGLVTWEQTKMMAMFLRCLRYVFGGHLLSRESALWWSRRVRTTASPDAPRIYYGLGFRNTLVQNGYCWIEPRIDWGRLQFKSEVTDNVLFGNDVLRGQYLQRGGQVQDFFDTTRRLDLAIEWMRLYRRVAVVVDRLTAWVVHICLQQFRVDVLRCVEAEIREDCRADVLCGDHGFCYDYLRGVLADGCYLLSGNKTDYKHPDRLRTYLFGFGDNQERQHWDDRGFRVLYRRAVVGMQGIGDLSLDRFERRFKRWLYKYHWVLPYPCYNALMQTTKQGQRMWYSISCRAAGGQEWRWERKDWQPGLTEPLPTYVGWSKEQWLRWIAEMQRRPQV